MPPGGCTQFLAYMLVPEEGVFARAQMCVQSFSCDASVPLRLRTRTTTSESSEELSCHRIECAVRNQCHEGGDDNRLHDCTHMCVHSEGK